MNKTLKIINHECIYVNGKVNNKQLKILIDTGANANCIFKSTINKLNLKNSIKHTHYASVNTLDMQSETFGTINNLRLEILDCNNKYKNISITAEVIRNNKNINMNNECHLILGIEFLKNNKAIIDFNTMTIILDGDIKINM